MYKELYRMAIYAKVVDNRSFSAAAKRLGLGRSVVSQHIRSLENGLGVRLINRNTRSFSLTDDGDRFYRYCVHMLETAEAALTTVNSEQAPVRGLLRITAPHNLGLSFVVGLVHRFRALHPEIEIDLALDDAVVNLIAEQVDIAIRVGPLRDSRHHFVKLCSSQLVMCAGQTFPRDRLPRQPADLVNVPWVEVPRQSIGHRLTLFQANGSSKTVKVYPTITTNSGVAAQALIRMGEGIGILPDYAVAAEIKSGALKRVLPKWRLPSSSISAVFPNPQLPPRSRLFLDFARSEFKAAFAAETRARQRPAPGAKVRRLAGQTFGPQSS
jgi:DNA-binding transcriptional LysR family regulator